MNKLEQKEIELLTQIAFKYREIRTSLDNLEKELEEINKMQELEISNLTELRKTENKLTQSLEAKYGPGTIDLLTLTWKAYESNT